MQRSTRVRVFMFSFSLFSACKSASPNIHDTTELAAANAKTFYYTFLDAQGFYSCTYANAAVSQYIDAAIDAGIASVAKEQHMNIAVQKTLIQSCFTGGAVEDLRSGTLPRKAGENFGVPEEIGKEQLAYKVIAPGGRVIAQNKATPDALTEIVQGHAKKSGAATRVILIGHSHGGWAAMRTALFWRNETQLRKLFTIDPISYKNCGQGGLIAEKLWNSLPLGSLAPVKGCQEAPADLAGDSGTIERHVQNGWTNYFETQFSLLHSSAITGASSNRELDYGFAAIGHTEILMDMRVWNSIQAQITGDIISAARGE